MGMPKFTKPAATRPTATSRAKKNFCVSQVERGTAGKKIIIYGKTGMGKSTLVAMAPNPVFVGPDNGLEDLDHPTGGQFNVIPGVDTFQDVRDATCDLSLFKDYETIVYDTGTFIQNDMCVPHVVENIKKEKGGRAKSITDFGWAKGYEHVYNEMQLLKADMDKLVVAGKNVIILCQLAQSVKTDSTYGEYFFDYPDLFDKKNSQVCAAFVSWASYVFKIGWAAVEIGEGKIGVSSDQRAVFVKPEFSFEAKSRGSKFKDYPIVTFDNESDDSVWRILFDGE